MDRIVIATRGNLGRDGAHQGQTRVVDITDSQHRAAYNIPNLEELDDILHRMDMEEGGSGRRQTHYTPSHHDHDHPGSTDASEFEGLAPTPDFNQGTATPQHRHPAHSQGGDEQQGQWFHQQWYTYLFDEINRIFQDMDTICQTITRTTFEIDPGMYSFLSNPEGLLLEKRKKATLTWEVKGALQDFGHLKRDTPPAVSRPSSSPRPLRSQPKQLPPPRPVAEPMVDANMYREVERNRIEWKSALQEKEKSQGILEREMDHRQHQHNQPQYHRGVAVVSQANVKRILGCVNELLRIDQERWRVHGKYLEYYRNILVQGANVLVQRLSTLHHFFSNQTQRIQESKEEKVRSLLGQPYPLPIQDRIDNTRKAFDIVVRHVVQEWYPKVSQAFTMDPVIESQFISVQMYAKWNIAGALDRNGSGNGKQVPPSKPLISKGGDSSSLSRSPSSSNSSRQNRSVPHTGPPKREQTLTARHDQEDLCCTLRLVAVMDLVKSVQQAIQVTCAKSSPILPISSDSNGNSAARESSSTPGTGGQQKEQESTQKDMTITATDKPKSDSVLLKQTNLTLRYVQSIWERSQKLQEDIQSLTQDRINHVHTVQEQTLLMQKTQIQRLESQVEVYGDEIMTWIRDRIAGAERKLTSWDQSTQEKENQTWEILKKCMDNVSIIDVRIANQVVVHSQHLHHIKTIQRELHLNTQKINDMKALSRLYFLHHPSSST